MTLIEKLQKLAHSSKLQEFNFGKCVFSSMAVDQLRTKFFKRDREGMTEVTIDNMQCLMRIAAINMSQTTERVLLAGHLTGRHVPEVLDHLNIAVILTRHGMNATFGYEKCGYCAPVSALFMFADAKVIID